MVDGSEDCSGKESVHMYLTIIRKYLNYTDYHLETGFWEGNLLDLGEVGKVGGK